MKRTMRLVLTSGMCLGGCAFAVFADWQIAVDPAAELGAIKPMNGVTGGPSVMTEDKSAARNADWAHARIPFGRTHDMNHSWALGGPHTIDVDAVFPDFDADENDPKSYDFTNTDLTLGKMREVGIEPYYRLGESIEPFVKKYHSHPPKDFAKWARVCEHIIRHCNEGWADGRRFGIRYWEIWCEPDLGAACWSGTCEQFLEFYRIAATHLKKTFPELKIGGPGFAGPLAWKDLFLPYCRREKVPLDFYSWHVYTDNPRALRDHARAVRDLLNTNGFEKAESILGEWNYVTGWSGGRWLYSRQVESGRFNQKAAAFGAAVMSECQNAPVDISLYYDTRQYGGMNMLFDTISYRPMKGYYPFYAWSRLRHDYGTQVKASVEAPDGQLFATAARDVRGNLAIWAARYGNDDNVHDWQTLKVRMPQAYAGGRAVCHLTDDVHTYTEIPVDAAADGTLTLTLVPNSFVLIEIVKSVNR